MRSLLWLLMLGIVQADTNLVETTLGTVQGFDSADGDYSIFLGIPYGKVDADNPFGASHPHPQYEETVYAFDDSASCPHMNSGTLDCLNLNVYVPKGADETNRVPVLVWIHGGGFTVGSNRMNTYGPKFLIKHNIAIVAINYRLGPYGFFCLETPEVPGNQGLKDQILALRWVRDNIAAFGGDPDKVTIMGESAGSGSVEYHLYSPHETLYHQIGMQSGTVFGPTFIQESDPVRPITIASYLGFETSSVTEALSFLAKSDIRSVLTASSALGLRYRPCVEVAFDGVESILTEHPLNLDIPKVKNLTVLAGFNSHEEVLSFVNMSPDSFENFDVFNEHLVQAFEYDGDFEEMANLVQRFYIGDGAIDFENRFILSDFQSDFKFNYPIQKSIKKHIDNGAQKVYQFMFSYNGNRNQAYSQNTHVPGAAHTDEVRYIFDMLQLRQIPMTEEDQRKIDQLSTMWANFVKYGNPTPETTELLPVKWLPVSDGVMNYLHIDTEIEMATRPYHDRLTFWELFYHANEKYLKAHR